MTEDRLPLNELLEKAGDGDFLRAVAESVLQLLMEADVEGLIGAGRHERAADRLNGRNGYRDRTLDTRLGSLNLKIPKLRAGSYFPPFLEARKTTEKALVAVIQEAWIGGVSTRRVDEIAQAMGLSGISKSQVSKLCKEIDERARRAEGRRPAGRRRDLATLSRALHAQCAGLRAKDAGDGCRRRHPPGLHPARPRDGGPGLAARRRSTAAPVRETRQVDGRGRA